MAPQVREEREDCIAVALAERTEELARVPLHRLAWQWKEVTPAMFLLLVVKKAVCRSMGKGGGGQKDEVASTFLTKPSLLEISCKNLYKIFEHFLYDSP